MSWHLHVDDQMFHRMRAASLKTLPPDDPALAAWRVADVGPPPVGPIDVKVTIPFDPGIPARTSEAHGRVRD
jgi:hypothetical protein